MNDGTLLKSPEGTDGTVEIKLGEAPAVAENVIDDFDYDNDDELNAAYAPNNSKSDSSRSSQALKVLNTATP